MSGARRSGGRDRRRASDETLVEVPARDETLVEPGAVPGPRAGRPGLFDVAVVSDQGRVRTNNEDFALVDRVASERGVFQLWVVADGMGGGPKGEQASEVAARTILELVAAGRWTDPGAILSDAFRLANERVHELALQQTTGSGMGTTLVAALVEEATGDTWIANVGDSRAYLLGLEGLRRITEDHSLVAMRVAAGQLTEEEAATDSARNVLVRGIGAEAKVLVDVFGPRRLAPGERILLCSDGLHGLLPDSEIERHATSTATPALPKVLVDAANEAGGRDNVTALIGGLVANAAPAGSPGAVAGAASAATLVTNAGAGAGRPARRSTSRSGGRRRAMLIAAILSFSAVFAVILVVPPLIERLAGSGAPSSSPATTPATPAPTSPSASPTAVATTTPKPTAAPTKAPPPTQTPAPSPSPALDAEKGSVVTLTNRTFLCQEDERYAASGSGVSLLDEKGGASQDRDGTAVLDVGTTGLCRLEVGAQDATSDVKVYLVPRFERDLTSATSFSFNVSKYQSVRLTTERCSASVETTPGSLGIRREDDGCTITFDAPGWGEITITLRLR